MTTPLGKQVPAGTKFAYLQCGAEACAVTAKFLGAAIKELGGSMTVVNAGSTAAAAQAAVSSVLALKPAVVMATGIQPSLYGGGLKRMSDAGIKVVSISVAGATKPFGIDFNYLGTPTFQLAGRLMADWVVAHKGAGANVVFYTVPELSFDSYMQQAFEQELAKGCPSCKVRTVPIEITALGTTAPQTIVTDLQAHQGTTVAVFGTGNLAAGVPAALKSAGVSVTTLTWSPQAGNLADIKSGGLTAGLAVDYPVSIWTAIDAAARLLLGESPTPQEATGEVPLQFLQQQDITFDPSHGWTGYPNYAERFATLWHPGA